MRAQTNRSGTSNITTTTQTLKSTASITATSSITSPGIYPIHSTTSGKENLAILHHTTPTTNCITNPSANITSRYSSNPLNPTYKPMHSSTIYKNNIIYNTYSKSQSANSNNTHPNTIHTQELTKISYNQSTTNNILNNQDQYNSLSNINNNNNHNNCLFNQVDILKGDKVIDCVTSDNSDTSSMKNSINIDNYQINPRDSRSNTAFSMNNNNISKNDMKNNNINQISNNHNIIQLIPQENQSYQPSGQLHLNNNNNNSNDQQRLNVIITNSKNINMNIPQNNLSEQEKLHLGNQDRDKRITLDSYNNIKDQTYSNRESLITAAVELGELEISCSPLVKDIEEQQEQFQQQQQSLSGYTNTNTQQDGFKGISSQSSSNTNHYHQNQYQQQNKSPSNVTAIPQSTKQYNNYHNNSKDIPGISQEQKKSNHFTTNNPRYPGILLLNQTNSGQQSQASTASSSGQASTTNSQYQQQQPQQQHLPQFPSPHGVILHSFSYSHPPKTKDQYHLDNPAQLKNLSIKQTEQTQQQDSHIKTADIIIPNNVTITNNNSYGNSNNNITTHQQSNQQQPQQDYHNILHYPPKQTHHRRDLSTEYFQNAVNFSSRQDNNWNDFFTSSSGGQPGSFNQSNLRSFDPMSFLERQPGILQRIIEYLDIKSTLQLSGSHNFFRQSPSRNFFHAHIKSLLIAGSLSRNQRGKYWVHVSKSSDNKIQFPIQNYRALSQCEPRCEKDILQDVDRTFPAIKEFRTKQKTDQLHRILRALSFSIPEMEYCQGLNYVVGTLLLYTAEEEAYYVSLSLLKRYGMKECFSADLQGLSDAVSVLDTLISVYLPSVSDFLKQKCVQTSLFAMSWFNTIFAYDFPRSFFVRVMDLFIFSGWKTLFTVSLAILQDAQQSIFKAEDDDDILPTIKKALGSVSEQRILENAMGFKISNRMLKELSQILKNDPNPKGLKVVFDIATRKKKWEYQKEDINHSRENNNNNTNGQKRQLNSQENKKNNDNTKITIEKPKGIFAKLIEGLVPSFCCASTIPSGEDIPNEITLKNPIRSQIQQEQHNDKLKKQHYGISRLLDASIPGSHDFLLPIQKTMSTQQSQQQQEYKQVDLMSQQILDEGDMQRQVQQEEQQQQQGYYMEEMENNYYNQYNRNDYEQEYRMSVGNQQQLQQQQYWTEGSIRNSIRSHQTQRNKVGDQ